MRALVLSVASTAALCVFTGQASLAQFGPDYSQVVQTCTVVSASEAAAAPKKDYQYKDHCVNAAGSYGSLLMGAALSSGERAEIVGRLVAALADLVNTSTCVQESEVARAIRLLAGITGDSGQAAQITLIADTVASCQTFVTAAIAPPRYVVSPSLVGTSNSRGTLASSN